MKMTQLTKTLMVAGVALSIGATPFIGTQTVSAATVVSQTAYEKVMSFTKADIKSATGTELKVASVNKVYTSLKQAATWKKLGYNAADAKRIAARFTQSQFQAVGILTDMANASTVTLKVVTITKPYYEAVNIGSMGTVVTPPNNSTDKPEENNSSNESKPTTPPTTPGTSILGKDVKEVEVEIEYNKKDIEFEYEVKSNGTIKAKFEDEFAGIKLEGKAAQTKIENLFAGLDIKNSNNTKIQNQLMNKLGASSNFKKFEFKAKFADKSKVEFKIK